MKVWQVGLVLFSLATAQLNNINTGPDQPAKKTKLIKKDTKDQKKQLLLKKDKKDVLPVDIEDVTSPAINTTVVPITTASTTTTTTTTTTTRPGCRVLAGKHRNSACVFPFRYRGRKYSGCTMAGHTALWCSVTTDTTGNTVQGEWGECSPECPVSPENKRSKLRRDLLLDYERGVHPVLSHTDNVTVELGMALIHLDLDERTSVLEVDAWMRMNWTDQNLVWDPADYDGLTQIHFGPDELWRPDIHLYNNADGSDLAHYGSTHFLVFNTGVVLWVPPAKFRSFCKIDLRLWPQDTQVCSLKFGSWTSHGEQIDLGLFHKMEEAEPLNFYTKNKEWKILFSTAERNENQYSSVPETYPDVTFTFNLQRDSPSYRAAVVLPCLLTMLLVVSSFLLPPTAGEKITINCVAFIACCLFLLHFQSVLPAMSDHIPLIVLFYSNTAALVGIAIILNVCCISLTRERRYAAPPKWIRNFFSGLMGRMLCLGNYYHQVSDSHHRLIVELDDIQDSPESDRTEQELVSHGQAGGGITADWILVAAGIERFFFLVYSLAFALVSSVYI